MRILNECQHIAVPLTFQFLAGFSLQTYFNVRNFNHNNSNYAFLDGGSFSNSSSDIMFGEQINNTYIVDTNQDAPAAAQASSNIFRCAISAVAVAVLQDIIDATGAGWTFTILGLLLLVPVVLCLVLRKKGITWRLKKAGSTNGVSEGVENDKSSVTVLEDGNVSKSNQDGHATEKEQSLC